MQESEYFVVVGDYSSSYQTLCVLDHFHVGDDVFDVDETFGNDVDNQAFV